MTDIAPAAHLIDVTRLVSRAGRVLTGVDRVERAFVEHVTGLGGFGLCRTPLGYLLVPATGLRAFLDRLSTGDWGPIDRVSKWLPQLTDTQKRAQSLLRRHAIARCRKRRLAAMLRKHALGAYLNVGHSNLTQATLSGAKRAGLRISVMIHDTIPFDFPQYQRPGTAEAFEGKLSRTARFADRIITVSETAAQSLHRHLAGLRSSAQIVTAPLGVTLSDPAPLPDTITLNRPYFVCLGTIEPRKNHALLLDIWEHQPPNATLVLCGSRGWENQQVFDRLDAGIGGVVEHAGLTDGQVVTLLQGAAGLLFPSHAEGFGLPLAEAATLGTPVLCGDLAICHEVLGDYGVYLDPTDPYQWANEIKARAATPRDPTLRRYVPPTWDVHFRAVLSAW